MLPLMFVSLAQAQEVEDGDGPRVALHFGWSAGQSCTVASMHQQVGSPEVIEVRRSFDVASHPDGLLVHQTALDVRGGLPASAAVEALRERDPDFVVGEDGHFVRIEGDADFWGEMGQEAQRLLAGLPVAMRPPVERTMAKLTSASSVEHRLATSWERSLGMWSGLDVAASTSGSGVTAGPSALFPLAAETQWFYRYHFGDDAPCDHSPDAPRCITLFYEGDAWGAGLKQLLGGEARTAVDGLPSEDTVLTWKSPSLTVRGEVLLDPTTMIPRWRTEQHQLKSLTTWEGGASVVDIGLRVTDRWTCEHLDEAASAAVLGHTLIADSPVRSSPIP